jgi:hemerythrin
MYIAETSAKKLQGSDTSGYFFPTGHEVIDRDHAALQNVLRQAGAICHRSLTNCGQCSDMQREACTTSAVDIVTDTLMSMVGHFRHEESLLQRPTATGTVNPLAEAHSDISQRMSQLVGDYADNNTARFLHRLTETLTVWLNEHMLEHDRQLVSSSKHTHKLQASDSALISAVSSAIS